MIKSKVYSFRLTHTVVQGIWALGTMLLLNVDTQGKKPGQDHDIVAVTFMALLGINQNYNEKHTTQANIPSTDHFLFAQFEFKTISCRRGVKHFAICETASVVDTNLTITVNC